MLAITPKAAEEFKRLAMVTGSDIRSSVGDFLEGKLTFDAFEDWIVRNTWNVHQWGDVEAQVLAYGIELRLAEYSLAALSMEDLRSELQNIAAAGPDLLANHTCGPKCCCSTLTRQVPAR